MATKSMKVCDLCNRPKDEAMKNSVAINGTEYKEICESCAKKIARFVKNLDPQTARDKKAKKEAVKE
jgi:hypothetical protein